MLRSAVAVSFVVAVAALGACAGDDAADPAASPATSRSDAATPSQSGDAAGVEAGADASVARARILFIGNSYTFFNDLPGVVRAIGDVTPGAAVEVDQITHGGAQLSDHSANESTRARIANEGWDSVVFQGASLEAISAPWRLRVEADVLARVAVDAGARPVWYATWARRPGDPIYDAGIVVLDASLADPLTPETMTTAIENLYASVAQDSGGVVARVGRAWQIALAEQPSIVLYADDGSHPTPAGTLLTACVMVRAIAGVPPRLPNPPPLAIPADDASALCAIAARL